MRRRACLLISAWLGALFWLTIISAAETDAPRPGDFCQPGYFAQTWTVDEGLSHNIVNRLLQDKRGFLWAASGGGLVRFDGTTFKEFPLAQSAAAAVYNVRALAEGPDGSLLILPASGGVMRLQGGSFSPHPLGAAMGNKVLLNLFVEPGGAIWVAASNRELSRWHDGQLALFSPPPGTLSGRSVFALDGHGDVWIATGDALGRYRDGRLTWLTEHLGGGLLIAPARSGGIWISSSERLMKFENEKLAPVSVAIDWAALERNSVQQLFEDRQGVLWVGTHRRGLFRLVSDSLEAVPAPADEITSILQDSEENIWIATNGGGIRRLRRKAFVTLDAAIGLADNVSTSIAEDGQGGLWCANRSGGLARYLGGRIERFGVADGVASPFMNVVCADRSGTIWAGASDGLYRIAANNPGQLTPASTALPNVHLLFCARNGDVWVGCGESGLGFFRGGVYTDCATLAEAPQRRVRGIAEAADGAIWLATSGRGLCQYVNGKFFPRFSGQDVPGGNVNALLVDSRGALWLATTNGLVLQHGAGFKRLGLREGVSDEIIYQLLEDDHGHLWCASRHGLAVFSLEELYGVANGRLDRAQEAALGKDDGLAKGSAQNSSVTPAALKARDGRLWFSTHGGLVGVDPRASIPRRPAPPVYLDEAIVDNRPTDFSAPIRLSAGDHQLRFLFTEVSFSAPARVRMRHQLVGFDADWVETGSDRAAGYAHLSPGSYRLRIVSSNQSGEWGEASEVFALTIPPAWWQTWIFRVAAGLGFATAFGWLVRYRSNRRLRHRLDQLEREQQIERERARIARDLHDDLGASVTQIGLMANRLKGEPAGPDLQVGLGDLAACSRRLAGELSGVVWTVSPKNDQWNRLAIFIRQFALDFFADTPITCTVNGVESAPALPLAPEVQHHVLAIVKEILNNILKHAQATRVKLAISFADDTLLLRIADNGRGFDPGAAVHAERNGLTNMHARAAENGGLFEVTSAPGSGTEVRLQFPLGVKSEPRSIPSS